MQTTCTATVNSHWLSTGSVQTFTAPVSGWYEVELWGSPGGNPIVTSDGKTNLDYEKQNGRSGAGGYTHVQVYIGAGDVRKDLYVMVGGNGAGLGEIGDDEPTDDSSDDEIGEDYEGTEHVDVAASGWNGGGATLTCQAGHHSASGGGMTHFSTKRNYVESDFFIRLQKTIYNTDGTVKSQDPDPKLRYNCDSYLNPGQATDSTKWAETTPGKKGVARVTDEDAIKKIANGRKYVRVKHDNSGIGGDKNHAWYLIYGTDWNPDGTIAVAGGGGGGAMGIGGQEGNRTSDGKNWIQVAKNAENIGGRSFAYAGGETAGKGKVGPAGSKYVGKSDFDAIPAAENATNTGYAQGKGQFTTGGSGSGGGWYGGYSQAYCDGMWTIWQDKRVLKQGNAKSCGTTGLGGTGYVDPTKVRPDESTENGYKSILWGGNVESIPDKPNKGTVAAEKGGYARITLVK